MKASTFKPASIRINPIIAGVAASVMILSLIGVGAITRLLPDAQEDAQPAEAARKSAPAGNCALCGPVEPARFAGALPVPQSATRRAEKTAARPRRSSGPPGEFLREASSGSAGLTA